MKSTRTGPAEKSAFYDTKNTAFVCEAMRSDLVFNPQKDPAVDHRIKIEYFSTGAGPKSAVHLNFNFCDPKSALRLLLST